VKLLDELFDLGDTALENQIAVVGLALGDFAGDDDAAVAIVNQRIDHVALHVGAIIDQGHLLLEIREDVHYAAAAQFPPMLDIQ
jgi:hypothetical protein